MRATSIAAAATAASLLGGCAGVSFRQLNADLTPRSGAPNGAIYYMPKPYLLVAQLPHQAAAAAAASPLAPDPAPPPAPGADAQARAGEQAPAGGWPAEDADVGSTGGAEEKAASGGEAATMVAGTDQSFGGAAEGYILKIVYLPDMSRPMSVSVRPGIGTASLKPTLQNGWMLTGFDAAADSQTAEILTALAPLLTAYKTPGKAAAAATGGAAAVGGDGGGGGGAGGREVLRPGLYEIRYDDRTGRLTGICGRTWFIAEGAIPATGTGSCG